MTMHPDTWPPRRAGSRMLDDGDLPPITHPERLAPSVDAPRRRSPVFWTLFRDAVAMALLGLAILMVAFTAGTLVYFAGIALCDLVAWILGGAR